MMLKQYFSTCVFQAAKAEWSQTLWVNLNIQLLQEGIEGYIKSLRKLPKDVRSLPVAFFLEGRMKELKESLPLLLDLKNEALRERQGYTLSSVQFSFSCKRCFQNDMLLTRHCCGHNSDSLK